MCFIWQAKIDLERKEHKGRSNFICTHYGEEKHSKLRRYEIIGYPEWWDFTKRPRNKLGQESVATSPQVQEVTTPMTTHTSTNYGMFRLGFEHSNTPKVYMQP